MMHKSRTVQFIVLLFLFVGATLAVAQNDMVDTTFVHVVDFQNGRFSSDIELAIEYKDGKLNLFSRSKTVGEIFKELEKKAKIEIKVDEGTAQKKVSIFVSDKTLKEGIEAVLNTIGQRDLAISYKNVGAQRAVPNVGAGLAPAQYEINKVEIRKRSKAEMEKIEEAEQKEADEEARQRDKEYRELFERMAKEKNKVAKALSDFLNPKATQKQKTQVMTYLRQATIEPKDKPLLRKALLDSKYDDLKGAIEMGLIHAIIDHPEESDKEYMLGLLKRRSGFLLMAMKFIWDDRFIPGLIDIVKNGKSGTGRDDAAEILGFRRIKEAVPALEEALVGMDNATSVLVALERITGMYYIVKDGKAVTITEPPKFKPSIIIPGQITDERKGKK